MAHGSKHWLGCFWGRVMGVGGGVAAVRYGIYFIRQQKALKSTEYLYQRKL